MLESAKALLPSVTAALLTLGALQVTRAQSMETVVQPPRLDRPLVFDSATRGSGGTKIPGSKFRVVPLLGFHFPYALAFLPDGAILVTERAGRLRIVRWAEEHARESASRVLSDYAPVQVAAE